MGKRSKRKRKKRQVSGQAAASEQSKPSNRRWARYRAAKMSNRQWVNENERARKPWKVEGEIEKEKERRTKREKQRKRKEREKNSKVENPTNWMSPEALLSRFWSLIIQKFSDNMDFNNCSLSFFLKTGVLNTLSPLKYICKLMLRPKRKIEISQKIFWPQFLYFRYVLLSVGVPFCCRTLFEGLKS